MSEPHREPTESEPERFLEVRRLGRTDYEATYALQQDLLESRIAGRSGDVLLLTEHEPIITHGRGAPLEPAAGSGSEVPHLQIERGGEATYHGPGQVIAYPIFHLEEGRRDLHAFLRDLEQVVIEVLAEFEVEGRREPGLTGVWIGDQKVASIGIAVRRWVTWHGLSLNVTGGHDEIPGFRPCGLDPKVMTCLAEHVQPAPTSILIEVLLVKHFCEVFGIELPPPAAKPPPGRFPDLPILPH